MSCTPHREAFRMLTKIYKPKDARRWLRTPNTALGGETPDKAIHSGRADEVLKFIARTVAEIEHGALPVTDTVTIGGGNP